MPPLDRSYEEYRSVLLTWLKTPNLTDAEVTHIQAMLQALEEGLDRLDLARHIAVTPAFLPTIQSAARKAMDAGLLLSWSQHLASQT